MTRLFLIAGTLAIGIVAPCPSSATAALMPLDGTATLGRAEPAQDARTPSGSVRLAIKQVDSKTKKKKVLTNPGEIKGFNPQPDPPARQQKGSAPQH